VAVCLLGAYQIFHVIGNPYAHSAACTEFCWLTTNYSTPYGGYLSADNGPRDVHPCLCALFMRKLVMLL
jgi:hypothetical protein